MNNTNNTDTYATKGSVIDMEEDTNKINRELIKAYDLGMVPVYAYYCYRCHLVWLPRYISGYYPLDYKEILLNSEPPKSCAKCKSKYWQKIP